MNNDFESSGKHVAYTDRTAGTAIGSCPIQAFYCIPAKVKQHHGWIRYNNTKRLSDSVVQSQRYQAIKLASLIVGQLVVAFSLVIADLQQARNLR
jgi:hypothetical protein